MSYPDFIEELILKKEYSALTDAEKQQLSEWVGSEEEYTKIRQLLLGIEGATIAMDEEEVPTHVKNNLQEAFAKKYGSKKATSNVRWRTVAIVSIAASVALLVYVGTLFIQQSPQPQVAENIPTSKKQEEQTAKPDTDIQDNLPKPQPAKKELKSTDIEQMNNGKEPVPPAPLPEMAIVEDDAEELQELSVEDEKRLAAPEKQLFFNETTIPPSYTSPASPTLDEVEIIIPEGDFLILPSQSISVAENKDLLQLNVEVF